MSPTRKLVQAALLFVAATAYSSMPAKAFHVSCESMREDCYNHPGYSFWFHECVDGEPSCGMYSCGEEPGGTSKCCWDMPVGPCGGANQ